MSPIGALRLTTRAIRFLPILAVLACTDARARALDGLRGVQLSPARAKPDFTLTDTNGQPFEFRPATSGTVTLLYFGYTNCTDVCPEHLSNIEAALRTMPPKDRTRVRVVFVTTDPARDTPARLRGWLDNFDRRFIGLRGNTQDVNQIETLLGLPASSVESAPAVASGSGTPTYAVGHAAQVLAFTPDDSLRAEYPSGFSLADWKNDLPKLLQIGVSTR